MIKNENAPGGKSTEKKCSQNAKINSLIIPAVIKNIQISKNLKILNFLHYKFSP